MRRTYNVGLEKDIDYDAFWDEIETSGSDSVYVPSRPVKVIYERPTSLRQCWYELTDKEAENLRNDPRVHCVEIPVEFRSDVKFESCAVQRGLYYKNAESINPANNLGINWGLFRINSATNNTTGTSGTLDYNYSLDGTGVDVVIMDSGCQIDHPEFTDANGVSRIQQIDWFAASGIDGTMPAFNTFYTDYEGHGTAIASIVAGKIYGRAKNSRIYIMSVTGVSPTTNISKTYAFDCIKGWHARKPVDPVTGYKRPTVVNISWTQVQTFRTDITGGNYRGTNWIGTTSQTQYGMTGSNNNGSGSYNVRDDNIDLDCAELLDAGVVLVASAGNYYITIDIPGGPDYNNYYTSSSLGIQYYQRGGSPQTAPGIICVGGTTVGYDAPERRYSFSNSGPRVDLYAPGVAIISAISTTNVDGATAVYPTNSSYKIALLNGTSVAAPQVAGMVAQLLQAYPTYTPAQIRELVINSSIPNMIYNTGSSTYTDYNSMHGGANRFAYMPFNSATNISAAGPCTMSNITINT